MAQIAGPFHTGTQILGPLTHVLFFMYVYCVFFPTYQWRHWHTLHIRYTHVRTFNWTWGNIRKEKWNINFNLNERCVAESEQLSNMEYFPFLIVFPRKIWIFLWIALNIYNYPLSKQYKGSIKRFQIPSLANFSLNQLFSNVLVR